MTSQVIPHRRKSKPFRWIFLLLLLSAGGFGIYDRYFREIKLPPPPVLQSFERAGSVQGREFAMTIYTSDADIADTASQAALQRAKDILQLVEPSPASALTQLNEGAPNQWHPLPLDLLIMVAASREYAEVTNGAYDGMTGGVTQMWQQALANGQYPPAEEFSALRKLSHWEQLAVQNETRSVRKSNDKLTIDLSGITLGYCLDEMMSTLQNQGIQSALITSGPAARVSNPPPGEQAWTVAIARPTRPQPDGIQVRNCGVFTAQVDGTMVTIEGRPVLAELNTATGLPATGINTATVLAPRSMMAQALANAAKNLPELVAGFPAATDIHSRIYTPEQAYLSSGFPKIVAYDPAPEKAAPSAAIPPAE